jgi:Leucine-rich repeat (LRR) protein
LFEGSSKSWWEKTTEKWFGERVRSVFFNNTQVSDLSPLAGLKNLKELTLANVQVSNLSPLAELKSLEWLDLSYSQVSDKQVQQIRQALPNCTVHHPLGTEEWPTTTP